MSGSNTINNIKDTVLHIVANIVARREDGNMVMVFISFKSVDFIKNSTNEF